MNKTEEPIIRRGLQMLAAITAEPWCPTDYRVGIERVRCDMLSLYTDAAEKKREEADELVNLSKAADTPWRPEVGKHPLLEGVGDYSAKQLRADAASEPEASIVPEWADCYACQGNGLAADGQDVCPHCDDGHISPRAQERLAGIQLTVFPWDPASDKHVYRVSIPGTEDVPTATVCWGVEVDEDATIERAYIVLGRIYSLHPEEVYATLVCCEPARRTLLAERPCSLMTLTSTDELLDLWGGRHGQNLQASVPGDDPDDQTTSPEDASLFDSMGPNFDPERAAGGELP